MANGVLGKAVTTANTEVKVYEVPATGVDFATVNFSVLNRSEVPATISVSIGTSDVVADADYIEDFVILNKGDILERTCQVMSPGEKLIVKSTESLCSIRVYGLEKPAAV